MYADQNDSAIVPARMYEKPEGKSNSENFYDVGNGMKYRARWIAILGSQVGVYAFNRPTGFDAPSVGGERPSYERQDYDNDVYTCPIVSHWRNERNHAYGYNYQFLGNARQTNDEFHNFLGANEYENQPDGLMQNQSADKSQRDTVSPHCAYLQEHAVARITSAAQNPHNQLPVEHIKGSNQGVENQNRTGRNSH